MIIFLIYIMGVIILMGSLLYVRIEDQDYLTLENILIMFLISLSSWFGIIVYLLGKFEDRII